MELALDDTPDLLARFLSKLASTTVFELATYGPPGTSVSTTVNDSADSLDMVPPSIFIL